MMYSFHPLLNLVLPFSFLLLISRCVCDNVECLDEHNQPVDWYYLYKLPMIKTSQSALVRQGIAYAYISSKSLDSWTVSSYGIDSKNSFPGRTLAHLYQQSKLAFKAFEPSDEMWLMYNDQPPLGNTSFYRGHTKGVITGNVNGGIWLVHSVPHFPPSPDKGVYSYPKTGTRNGQSFLCISMHSKNLDVAGMQLIYNNPLLYSLHFGGSAIKLYPQLYNVSKFEGKVKNPPYTHKMQLMSKSGFSFISYAKTSKFQKDLYDDFLTDDLQSPLRVETWPNGRDRLHSDCIKPYHTENIDDVKIDSFEFSAHKDHSKWAISIDESNPWTCVGDINRAKTQFSRGGGTVCLKDPRVHKSYNEIVAGVEACQKPSNNNKYSIKKYWPDFKKWWHKMPSIWH